MTGFANTKRAAAPGLSALRISGAAQILMAPSKPMTTNQTTMTGPNRRPMLAVPRCCIANSPIRIASVSGRTKCSNAGVTSLRPSMAESTDGRRDDAVAIEQRRARDAEQDQNRGPRTIGNSLHQRQQRQDSAFAVVVGAQDEDDVFERHHRHQRPEDERDDPEDVDRGRDGMAGGAQRDGQGIERARADIAEHDAGRGEREEPGIALMVQFAAVGRIGARSRGRDVAGRSFHRPISLAKSEAYGRSGPQTFQQWGRMRDGIVLMPGAALSLTMS